MIEDNAGLHGHHPPRRIEVDDLVEPPRGVEDKRLTYGLTALARPRTPGQERHAMVARDIECDARVGLVAGHDHADGHDLVDGSIGGIASPAALIEQHVAAHFPGEALGERGCRTLAGLPSR